MHRRHAASSTAHDSASPCVALPPRHHRGAVIHSALTLLCSGAVLLTAALVVDPASLQAGSPSAAAPRAPRDAHAELTTAVASIINQARDVLVVHPATNDRPCDIVLWFDDRIDHQRINSNELALIRFSPLFRSVSLYTPVADLNHVPAEALSLETARSPGFIDRWSANPAVQARIIATGVSGMTITGLETNGLEGSRLEGSRLEGSRLEGSQSPSPNLQAGSQAPSPKPQIRPLSASTLRLTWDGDPADEPQATAAPLIRRVASTPPDPEPTS